MDQERDRADDAGAFMLAVTSMNTIGISTGLSVAQAMTWVREGNR